MYREQELSGDSLHSVFIDLPYSQYHSEQRMLTQVQWNLSMAPDMSTCIVPVVWSSTRRTLYSPRKPPVQLHVCIESRFEALKLYARRFATSPEFARTYFSYENDILLLDWASLGTAPGRLGRKIGDEEASCVRTLMINEEALLLHAREGMRELGRFQGIRDLAVLCDSENVQSGDMFGAFEIESYSAILDIASDNENDSGESEDGNGVQTEENHIHVEKKSHRWPELVCLREHEDGEKCSRHWWFEWWNQRASNYDQKFEWTTALADCLQLTSGHEHDERDWAGHVMRDPDMMYAFTDLDNIFDF